MSEESKSGQSKRLSVLFSLFLYLKPYKLQLIGASCALVLTAGVNLAMGQGVRILIDQGFLTDSSSNLDAAALLLLFMITLMAVGIFVRFYLVSWLGERVSADIRRAVFDHLVTLHPSYFETNASGEIMSRLTTDTTLLQTIIGSSFSMALRSVLSFVGGLIMMLITNFKLSLIVLSCVPLVLLPIMIFGRRVRKLARKSQDSIANVGSYAGEVIQNIKTVQSYQHEPEESLAFGAEVEEAFTIARHRIAQRAFLMASVVMLVFSAITAMLWVGGNDVLRGTMTGGELGAFIFYAILIAIAVGTISEVYGELQRAAGATERLTELLAVSSLIVSPVAPQPIPEQAIELEIEHLSFSYPSRLNQRALDQLSLNIPAGRSLALVGPSGAGKSSVFELLQRFYDPQQGRICANGVDIRALDLDELRQLMGVVPQQPTLFSTDVFHNIRYGKAGASDEDVIEAAKAAHAHDFILSLPEGYASPLGDRGVRLSGGQRQRIAIARAILKDPKVLLLDEATSALDAQSEHEVQAALKTLMKDRTTVIIAHRLSTILHADQIAVMDEGKLVALGNHESLMHESELYQRLAKLQFRDQLGAVS